MKNEIASFSDNEYNLISYAYSRLLQDFVVRGIKHTESGSSEFKPFLLKNIVKREYRAVTYKFFCETIGLGKNVTDKLFEILAWGESNDYISQIASFISFYNTGNIHDYNVTIDFEGILLDTFYGSRLQPYFDLKNEVSKAHKLGFKYEMTSSGSSDEFSGSTKIVAIEKD
jgi:hypothetical protein